jgi:hypothetical protein
VVIEKTNLVTFCMVHRSVNKSELNTMHGINKSKAPELLPNGKDVYVLLSFISTGLTASLLTRQNRLTLIKILVLMKSDGY